MILTEASSMNSEEIKAEYTSSLADLTCNSKPLINVLTMLAEENLAHAPDIVTAIEEHLAKVQTTVKLPILYLIDCIVKNIGQTYTTLFSQNLVMTFCSVFKVVDEETRAEMFKLRQTWNNIFPQKKLYAIDVQIRMLDPAWPVTAQPPSNSIHLNPKFLKSTTKIPAETSETTPASATPNMNIETFTMQQKLIQKQKELIELQQKKLKLELLQTQVKLQKQLENNPSILPTTTTSNNMPRTQNVLLKPEVAKQLMPDVAKQLSNVKKPILPNAPRISPVNSALATATRPTRDPRLLRQQTEKTNNGTSSSTNSNSNSIPLGSKTAILDSNNKIVTNSKGVRDSRIEPRLVNNNNKDDVLTSKSKNFPKSSTSSRHAEQQKIPTKSSRSNKNNVDNSCSKSSSLLDSPSKSKSDKSDLKSSPSKHKKKDHHIDNKKIFKDKRDRDSSKGHKKDISPTTFKNVKGSTKNRNFRRNRSPSFSPEINQDTDLRVPPEKQARLSSDSEDKGKVNPMDVDLRQINNITVKKRNLSDPTEHSTKKSKNQVFDTLFGNEDTDLRTVLPVVQPDRPPTPPPPIISEEKEPVKKVDLDAIRAKLANATGRDKIMAKSFRKKRLQEDEDLRVPPSSDMKKIIISSDDEQSIKAGTMTKEQEKQLMNKIIAQIEHQKLKEAQLKDKQDNIQPVSDDDLEVVEDKDDRVNYHNKYGREGRRGGSYWRGRKQRHWENPHPRSGPIKPWLSQQQPQQPSALNAWRPIGPNLPKLIPEFSEQDGKRSPEVPGDLVVDSVNQDDIKTINIDGVPRDIRYYDETAIVFMNWDDPREISFQSGNRRVVFDDSDVYFLGFNEGYKELSISGTLHSVRLGAPTREIFIDGKPYECYFGGPGINIDLNGQMIAVKLDGPPPQVKIGNVKKTDLVAGKVNLIIDAKILVPVFLDAKVQKFVIDGETHSLKFVDALKTVLINDVPFKVEFGGLPKPITVHEKKHFIRFSVLPRGVKPGVVSIKDMDGGVQTLENQEETSQDAFVNLDINEPALPVFSRKKKMEDENDRNSNSPHFFQNFMQQNNLDVLSSVMTSSLAPTSSGGYQVENLPLNSDAQNSQSMETAPIQNPVPLLPASLNINELFQKLVATGIVATKEPLDPANKTIPKRTTLDSLKFVTFSKSETLKLRQNCLYDALYSGMQCSSCGMRFPPEQSMHYSQHLDWHFRQNRKGKKNIRVAASRKWYYSLSDWKNYEEIEDLEEREKNYFDQQQQQNEGNGEDGEEEIEIPSVPADPDIQDPQCEVCQDKFDQFFNEDKEEWHLRNAIRVDDKTYHPVCYEDYHASLQESMDESKEEFGIDEAGEESKETNIPGLEIVLDDDDEEEEEEEQQQQPTGDEVVIDESDESNKPSQEEEKSEETLHYEDDDDDVIINEVVPEKIEVDDEREYSDNIEPYVPIKMEQIDDGFMDVEDGVINIHSGGQIKIKSEPIDPDELPMIVPEEEPMTVPTSLPSQPAFVSSIDGNTEPLTSVPTTTPNIGGRIKINISKPLPVIPPKEPKDVPSEIIPSLEPVIDPSQPLPPGEEPVQLNIKPSLRGIELKKLPPVKKGSELTGMCSIM